MMTIRERILRLAIEAESDNKRDAAHALYLIAGTMEPDGSHCRFAGFIVDLINDGCEMDWAGDFDANPDVLGAVAAGVNLSLRLPVVSGISPEEYALSWPILED